MSRYQINGDWQGEAPTSSILEPVLEDIRDAFRGDATRSQMDALINLHGSTMTLMARAQRIARIVRETSDGEGDDVLLDDLEPSAIAEFQAFYRELLEFGVCLNRVSMAAIDIYFPGLQEDLVAVVGRDLDFSYAYTRRIAPKYGLSDRELPITLVQILDRYDGDWGPENRGGQLMLEFGANPKEQRWGKDGRFYHHRDVPTQVSASQLLNIIELLARCRDAIREIVRETMAFKDVVQQERLQVTIQGGVQVTPTTYNVSNSQVGAIGPNAHVHDLSLRQVHDEPLALINELERLQVKLARLAVERDQFAAVIDISEALVHVRNGDTASAYSQLAAAGPWALTIAKEEKLSVVAQAIGPE